jgi:hypothetical protein
MSAEGLMRSILTVMLIKRFLRTSILTRRVSLTLAGPPPDVTEPARAFRAVGPGGQGNAAASTAWKLLAGDAPSRFHRPV